VEEDRPKAPSGPDAREERPAGERRGAIGSLTEPVSEPEPEDVVDEWGYESFPASDPPQH
jgi:hypothetical protein